MVGDAGTVIELISRPVCPLAAWSGSPQHCHWCDGPARAGERWCSAACEDAYLTNHVWERARSAALARDHDRCTECGTGPDTVAAARLLIRALIPMGPVEAARLWQGQDRWALELACSVDVLHRTGHWADYRPGCHHHLDGLETRCRRHQQAAPTATSHTA